MPELARPPVFRNLTGFVSGEKLNQIVETIPLVITGDGATLKKVGTKWVVDTTDPNYVQADPEVQYLVVIAEQADYLQCVLFSWNDSLQQYDPNLGVETQLSGLSGSFINVAKPQWLQQSAWLNIPAPTQITLDGLGVTFQSLGINRRLVKVSIPLKEVDIPLSYRAPCRIQEISPPYVPGTIIAAKQTPTGLSSLTGIDPLVWDGKFHPYQYIVSDGAADPTFYICVNVNGTSSDLSSSDWQIVLGEDVAWQDVNDAGRTWQDNSLPQKITITNAFPYTSQSGSTFAAVWDLRDNENSIDTYQSQIWVTDQDNADILPLVYDDDDNLIGPTYNGVFAGFEVGGPFWLSVIANNTSPLTDVSAWIPLSCDPLYADGPMPWQSGAWDFGDVVLSGGIYACSNPDGTSTQPPSADWRSLSGVFSSSPLDLTQPIKENQYGQQEALIYTIKSGGIMDMHCYRSTGTTTRPGNYFPSLNTYYSGLLMGGALSYLIANAILHAVPFIVPVDVTATQMAVWLQSNAYSWDTSYACTINSVGEVPGGAGPGAPSSLSWMSFDAGAPFWAPGSYAYLAIVQDLATSSLYICNNVLGTSGQPGVSSDWTLMSLVEWNPETNYSLGDYVLPAAELPPPASMLSMGLYEGGSFESPYPKRLLFSGQVSLPVGASIGQYVLISINPTLRLTSGRVYWLCMLSNAIVAQFLASSVVSSLNESLFYLWGYARATTAYPIFGWVPNSGSDFDYPFGDGGGSDFNYPFVDGGGLYQQPCPINGITQNLSYRPFPDPFPFQDGLQAGNYYDVPLTYVMPFLTLE